MMKTLHARRLLGPGLQGLLCTLLLLFSAVSLAQTTVPAAGWNNLLQKNVKVIDDGHAAQVDYAGMRGDQAQLDAYTHQLSAVTAAQFHGWNKNQQKAFLINAYNAFTVQLVLTRWPKLSSIKDLGGLFSSPWKIDFFTLLGSRSTLDQIEKRLRSADYADPRVHFALNCASISCPMLRNEAYVAEKLDHQLDDAMDQFLADHSRNRYDPHSDELQVSKIFDWYASDFKAAPYHSVTGLLALHAKQLSDDPKVVARIQAQKVDISYLPYDWHLNKWTTP